ncbi:hypothetical protein EMIHUDRAFT_242867 [Emiliania huxleyi CCMP1516]|uniref:DNA-directed RNA polymerase III subunit RPC3 n=2 Tax=Emiliania huxleyi TaxID=2903 RepID=A0A0D3J794_EMIH1|nr:hypothetical protein EMIHUDRAFT_242867 [Emiliania huxleyi CCMP1516]EOD19379.1 hypothetical protein EMIHUDRAFT_242867 [Emiliania huxleyi CCMP1516]|eukprot:XP_005771808.1 hypothetical protein EMIHUDRAFT_242867 [Emiliania huxleyi CCMP1516]
MESSGSGSSLSLKVAGQILRSDLGELVETVGVHLLEHGPCTLIQLASGLESTGSTLTATQIRASLLVLFQHNIASVLARRWYPWVVCATRRRIGDDAAALLVEVLALGRCTLDSLSRRLAPERGARREALKAEGVGAGREVCGEGCVAVCLRFGRCKLMHEKFDATAAQLLDAVLAMQPTCPQDRQPPDLTHGAWPLPHSQEERGKPCTTPFTECGPLLEGHEFESDRRQLAVLNRCGEAACRLFRLLLRFRANGGCPKIEDGVPRVYRLELKQLAELGLMPEKEARPLLWTLMSAGFASLQEAPPVPWSVDHNPRTTCYLWYVDLPRAYRALEAQLLQTHARLATMLEAEQSKAGEQPTSSPPPPTRRSAMIEARPRGAALLRTSETLMLVRYV